MAEQNNFAISEFINNKKAESNYEPIKNRVRNPLFLIDKICSRHPSNIAMGENMIQGTRMTRTLQYISVKNKGFLAGDRLKKGYSPKTMGKFRREVFFGTPCIYVASS